MRVFKVYQADGHDFELVLAQTHYQAAQIARTVWDEAGTPHHHVKVIEMCLPSGEVGLIYEPNSTPIQYPRLKRTEKQRRPR
jgi:hypothetical protein